MHTNVIIGDCRIEIPKLEDQSIDCIMTSPPYWGLRDYGHSDQLGLEQAPEEYLKNMINVFDVVKPKLKDVGNCFVNLGDNYSGSSPKKQGDSDTSIIKAHKDGHSNNGTIINFPPAKSMCMIPQRFAWGMIEHGWILRNEIIWHKPNHMPESVTDRLTKSHEVIYHFVKQGKYYYDLDAIRKPFAESSIKRITQPNVMNQTGGKKQTDLRGNPISGNASRCNKMVQSLAKKYDGKFDGNSEHEDFGSPRARTQRKPYAVADRLKDEVEYRNDLPSLEDLKFYLSTVRNGLTIDDIEVMFKNQAPHHWFSGESHPSANDWIKLKEILHFDDTYDFVMTDVKLKPSDKVNNQIGKNPGDMFQIDEPIDINMLIQKWKELHPEDWAQPNDMWQINTQPYAEAHFAVFPIELIRRPILAGCPVGGMVLDPFGGSGTVAEFCRHNERECTIIELNDEYKPLIEDRSMNKTPILQSYGAYNETRTN